MLDKTRNIVALISLISFIYVLRDSQTSPGTFLSHNFSRMLDNSTALSDALCDGVDRNDPITTSEQERADGFRTSISNIRNGNPLVDFINSPTPPSELGSEYLLPILKFGVPWLVFLVISLLGCLYFMINWCCMYACSGGIKCCKAPTNKKFKNCFVIGSVVFMIATLAVGIAGIVVGSGFPKAGRETICSTAIFVEKLLQGSKSDRWVGAEPAAQKLLAVIDNLHPVALSLVNPTVVVGPFASVNYATTDTILTAFATNNANRDAKRGDPAIATNYKPIYIQNINARAGAIRTELQAKNTLLTGASTRLAADTAGLEATGVLASFIDLRETAVNMSRTASNIRDSFVDGGSRGRRAFNGIGGGFLGVFAAKMFFAIISMASILLVARGALFFNKVLHCSWCCIGILVILGWILSTILFPLNVVLFEVCDVMDRIQVEPAFFNRTFDKFLNDTNKTNDDPNKNNTRNTLYRCFYGDGDLLVNTRTALTVFIDIADVLDKTAPLTESIQTVPDSQEISSQETLIINYGSGLVPDGEEATTDLNKLNTYTNGNSCSPIKDKWVLNSQSCTSSDGYVFKNSDSANTQVTQQTCIGFDAWGSKDITQRYTTQHFSGCSVPTANVQAFVNSFGQSRTAVSNLFTTLKSGITIPPSSFDNIKSSNKLFMDDVRTYTSNEITPYRVAYDPLYQPLSNQTDGLIPNCNCSFVRNSFRDLEQKLCIRFTPILFQILIAMIIISFTGSFGALMLFCLAKRFVVDTKGKYQSVNKF